MLLVNYDPAAQLYGGYFQIQEARDSGVAVALDGNKRVQATLRATDPQVYGGPRAETAVVGNAASRPRRHRPQQVQRPGQELPQVGHLQAGLALRADRDLRANRSPRQHS